MPKVWPTPHDGIPYHSVKEGEYGGEPGCYQLHTPHQCRLRFPATDKYIHKCEIPTKEYTQVPHGGTFRTMIVPKRTKNYYPAIMHKNEYERLKAQARIKSQDEVLKAMVDQEKARLQAAKESEERKDNLKKMLQPQYAGADAAAGSADPELEGPDQTAYTLSRAEKSATKDLVDQEKARLQAAKESEERKDNLKKMLQPQYAGADAAAGSADPELEGPDQTAYTLSRAEMLLADNMQGPRLCNRIILASKAHAIRDAQCAEKELIKKELTEEEKRLDAIMEENRVTCVERAEFDEERRHGLRLQNLHALKEQIKAHETAKIMEQERVEEEAIRVNQANIAMQIDEALKQKARHEQRAKLKAVLDEGNAELLYFKQLQNEEDRIMDLRIKNFMKAKQERDAKNRREAEAVKAAKLKGIAHIASAQKAEQDLKEELERIRNLKIQEDVERDLRRKERDAAIKRHRDIAELHEARSQQIKDIHRLIAREIAKDEQSFNNAIRQNEEFLEREKKLQDKKKAQVEKHRQEIMKQINDKERARADLREKIHNEGVALRLEQEAQAKYEKRVIKQKVQEMRHQKISEKYVKEVEQTLAKQGY